MINKMLLDLLASIPLTSFRSRPLEREQIFEKIAGYEGIKRTFVRSLNAKEPVHILLVGPPGQAKTLFLKCIAGRFGKSAFFTVGGNASKSGLIDVLFDMRPKYLLIDEIEHLKAEYQTTLLSLMETGILRYLYKLWHSIYKHENTYHTPIVEKPNYAIDAGWGVIFVFINV